MLTCAPDVAGRSRNRRCAVPKHAVIWQVRDLISVDDVMEVLRLSEALPKGQFTGHGACGLLDFKEGEWKELDYGPNGGLVYAMEYLSENMSWLEAFRDPP